MRMWGFAFSDKEHILLRTTSHSKKERVDYVKSISEVVLFGGDSLNDLGVNLKKETQENRRKWVDDNKEKFGSYYLVLPNTMYGNWEKEPVVNAN